MAVIGELATLITARTQPFERGMKRVRSDTRRTSASIRSANTAVTGLLTSLAGFAGVSFGIAAVRDEFGKIDEIAKTAARIGTTTEEISRLQFAAELTGAGADKLSAALNVMQKRLGEAARGSGAATKALAELGLSAQHLIGLDPADAFRLIADRISQLDTQSQKAAATANIFSRANQALVNTLELGAEGLAEMGRQSDKVGNTVDQTITADVEAANDAMTAAKASVGALKREMVVELAPAVKDLAEIFTNLNEVMGEFNKGGDDGGGFFKFTGLGDFGFGLLSEQAKIVNLALQSMKADLQGNHEEAKRLANELLNVVGVGKELAEVVKDPEVPTSRLIDNAKDPFQKMFDTLKPSGDAPFDFADDILGDPFKTMFEDIKGVVEDIKPFDFADDILRGPSDTQRREVGAAQRDSVQAAKILSQVRGASQEQKQAKRDEERNSLLAAINERVSAGLPIVPLNTLL